MQDRFIIASSWFNRPRVPYWSGDLPFGAPLNDVMTRRIAMATSTLVLVLSAVALVWSVDGEDRAESSVPWAEAIGAPAADVPGVDVPGLPRYPGSARVAYGSEVMDGLATTQARYEVVAELDAVREFYRHVFQTQGWSEVDVRFSQGRWGFLVVSGQREARVRIKARGALVEIAIGLSEPVLPTGRSSPTMPAVASSASIRPGLDRIGSRHP
jgi:hypothetical protein